MTLFEIFGSNQYIFPIQYFIFLILKQLETSGIKFIKLRKRIKNE